MQLLSALTYLIIEPADTASPQLPFHTNHHKWLQSVWRSSATSHRWKWALTLSFLASRVLIKNSCQSKTNNRSQSIRPVTLLRRTLLNAVVKQVVSHPGKKPQIKVELNIEPLQKIPIILFLSQFHLKASCHSRPAPPYVWWSKGGKHQSHLWPCQPQICILRDFSGTCDRIWGQWGLWRLTKPAAPRWLLVGLDWFYLEYRQIGIKNVICYIKIFECHRTIKTPFMKSVKDLVTRPTLFLATQR